jgi:hypothetical protein
VFQAPASIMSGSDSNLSPEEKKQRDRAIWLIYGFMIVLIALPMMLFVMRHVL